MDRNGVVAFLEALRCQNINANAGGWVRASCPLAPWLHAKGRDAHPSFGVRPATDKENAGFHCFSCGTSGSLPKLLHNLTWLSGERPLAASRVLMYSDWVDQEPQCTVVGRRRIKIHDKFASKGPVRAFQRNEPVPEVVLDRYPPLIGSDLTDAADVLRWLVEERRISEEVVARYQLRLFSDHITGDVGVVFPVLSRDSDRVLDMYVRMTGEKAFFRLNAQLSGSPVDYKAPNLWFGNHLYKPDAPVMLVEGPIDAMRLSTLGVANVLAACGEPSRMQLAGVSSLVVHVAFDADASGREFAKKALRLLSAPVRRIIEWDVGGIKDAGDLQDKAQLAAIFNASRRIELTRDADERRRQEKRRKASRTRDLTFDPFGF